MYTKTHNQVNGKSLIREKTEFQVQGISREMQSIKRRSKTKQKSSSIHDWEKQTKDKN